MTYRNSQEKHQYPLLLQGAKFHTLAILKDNSFVARDHNREGVTKSISDVYVRSLLVKNPLIRSRTTSRESLKIQYVLFGIVTCNLALFRTKDSTRQSASEKRHETMQSR